MNKLTKTMAILSTGAILFASAAFPAVAVTPGDPVDVTGAYVIDFTCVSGCAGTFPHDATFTQTGNAVDGSGGYPVAGPPYDFSWDVTTGAVSGNTIDLTIDYLTGALGTTMHMTGTIAPNGSMSGVWDDNFEGNTRTGTWSTSTGEAQIFLPEECDDITLDGDLIVGTNNGEILNGTADNDLILARGGSDVVNGNGGNDCIVGGAGSDLLRGNGGADVILGGADSDSIAGGVGDDEIYGEGDSDALNGEGGNDDIFGGAGSDAMRGEGGTDTLTGDGGSDAANGGAGAADACSAEAETQCEL